MNQKVSLRPRHQTSLYFYFLFFIFSFLGTSSQALSNNNNNVTYHTHVPTSWLPEPFNKELEGVKVRLGLDSFHFKQYKNGTQAYVIKNFKLQIFVKKLVTGFIGGQNFLFHSPQEFIKVLIPFDELSLLIPPSFAVTVRNVENAQKEQVKKVVFEDKFHYWFVKEAMPHILHQFSDAFVNKRIHFEVATDPHFVIVLQQLLADFVPTLVNSYVTRFTDRPSDYYHISKFFTDFAVNLIKFQNKDADSDDDFFGRNNDGYPQKGEIPVNLPISFSLLNDYFPFQSLLSLPIILASQLNIPGMTQLDYSEGVLGVNVKELLPLFNSVHLQIPVEGLDGIHLKFRKFPHTNNLIDSIKLIIPKFNIHQLNLAGKDFPLNLSQKIEFDAVYGPFKGYGHWTITPELVGPLCLDIPEDESFIYKMFIKSLFYGSTGIVGLIDSCLSYFFGTEDIVSDKISGSIEGMITDSIRELRIEYYLEEWTKKLNLRITKEKAGEIDRKLLEMDLNFNIPYVYEEKPYPQEFWDNW